MSDSLPALSKAYIRASITTGTWKKHSSALNCFRQFEVFSGAPATWPLQDTVVCEFASWSLSKRGLRPSTVRSYLSSLSKIHELKGLSSQSCSSPLVKRVLRGAENLVFYQSLASNTRKVMSLPLLKLLGHEISRSEWSSDSKQVFWTACVTAFFGSFQFGELLSPTEWGYNQHETLLWSDIYLSKDSALIHVKISKNRNAGGGYIDLFPFPGHNCCPVKCLLLLKKMYVERNVAINVTNMPVFAFSSGKLLTVRKLNEVLELLFRPHLGSQAAHIQSHSFRAAIPAAMADNPALAKEEDLKS